MRPSILPKPTNLDEAQGIRGPDMWVDEAIWGHRLYDEQTPWLAFLEFLNVLQSEVRNGHAFRETNGFNTLEYRPRRYLYLRNVLFNNPRLPAFLKELPDDDTRWTQWAEYMAKTADGLRGNPSFHFIRDRFTTFEEFSLVVHLLRTTAIEGRSNKRWTSKFVFPYGPAALYEDLNVKPQSVTNDRRFFGRVGELVYLMLCRSGRGEDLLTGLRPLILDENSRWNRLVQAFRPQETEDVSPDARPSGTWRRKHTSPTTSAVVRLSRLTSTRLSIRHRSGNPPSSTQMPSEKRIAWCETRSPGRTPTWTTIAARRRPKVSGLGSGAQPVGVTTPTLRMCMRATPTK